MQSADLLQTVAEVSIAFAGFTSVVAVLGRRATGEWAEIDRFRLSVMLSTSLAALLFALLPLVLAGLRVPERLSWGLASAILAAYVIFLGTSARRGIQRLPPQDQSQIVRPALWATWSLAAAVAACLLLNTTGMFFHREPGPYLLGLYFLLALSAFQFTRLLLVIRRSGGNPGNGGA